MPEKYHFNNYDLCRKERRSMKKFLLYLIVCINLFIVSCGRAENNRTKDEVRKQDDALEVVSNNELSRVDKEESMISIIEEKSIEIMENCTEENILPENNIEQTQPINPNIEIKGDINWSEEEAAKAIEIYQEFIWGKREIDGWHIDDLTVVDVSGIRAASIPITEAERYPTRYALWDTNGDGIPELHFDSARYYYVFSYKDGNVFVWMDLTNGIECILRKDGGFITWSIGTFKSDLFVYHTFDYCGEDRYRLEFSWDDTNMNDIHDKEDEYLFDDVPVSQDIWEKLVKRYICQDENGTWAFVDELDWVILYEGKK